MRKISLLGVPLVLSACALVPSPILPPPPRGEGWQAEAQGSFCRASLVGVSRRRHFGQEVMLVRRTQLQVPRYLTPRPAAAPPQAELRDGLQAAALELRVATEVR